MPELRLSEWDRVAASEEGRGAVLRGLYLSDPMTVKVAKALSRGNRLRVSENRQGLVLESRQHVGVVQLGQVRVRITPKLQVDDLWHILAYGLGLRHPERNPPAGLSLSADFADLLALLLVREADALLRSGMRRGYVNRSEWLAAPRGRPILTEVASHSPLDRAALPCRYHHFETDTLDNQVVLAGLQLARHAARAPAVMADLGRAARGWAPLCREIRLSGQTMDEAARCRSRLTAHYEPAHSLVRAFVEQGGLDDEWDAGEQPIPGFLWDMSKLFEAFVVRFLTEHLETVEVCPQHTLKHLFRVVSPATGFRSPRPRPDIVLRRDRRVVGVIDTKYRDLGSGSIPRDILYQLSVYALAWLDDQRSDVPATVLYPRLGPAPTDRVVALRHGFRASESHIRFRAIDWSQASQALRNGDANQTPADIAAAWMRDVVASPLPAVSAL